MAAYFLERGAGCCVFTMGADGSALVDKSGTVIVIPAYPVSLGSPCAVVSLRASLAAPCVVFSLRAYVRITGNAPFCLVLQLRRTCPFNVWSHIRLLFAHRLTSAWTCPGVASAMGPASFTEYTKGSRESRACGLAQPRPP